MNKRGVSIGQIGIAVAFAFSCFALLLFLWTTFGGPIPLKPEGYRIKVPVQEAAQLAVEADVRISNVSVGKVKSIDLSNSGPTRDRAVATIEIDGRYAPLPSDTRAMLREKTLLGETYLALTQGDEQAPKLAEGATLPPAQVEPSVQLDEIFRTFDARTRAAFQSWMQQASYAFKGRGADLSAAIANLDPFAQDATRVLRVLDTQQGAVKQLIRSTGDVFGALSERKGQLSGLIRNSATVFRTTAVRNRDIEATFRALPTFLNESQLTLRRLQSFSRNANPLITQLHPSARALSADLKQVGRVAPDFKGFFVGLRKTEQRGLSGLPALQQLVQADLPPLLNAVPPFARQINPIVSTVGRYQRDVTGFLGNVTAATNAVGSTEAQQTSHYLRTSAALLPDSLAVFGPNAATRHRLQTSRTNPYPLPDSALKVAGGLDTFDTRPCSPFVGLTAQFDPNDATYTGNANFSNRAYFTDTPDQILQGIKQSAFREQNTSAGLPAPPCTKSPPQQSIGQIPEMTDYLHVYANP